jgi:hypothetical protein
MRARPADAPRVPRTPRRAEAGEARTCGRPLARPARDRSAVLDPCGVAAGACRVGRASAPVSGMRPGYYVGAAECRAARSLGGPFDVALGRLRLPGRWRKALRRYLPASPHRSTDRRRARAALRGPPGGRLAQTWALSRTRVPLRPTTAAAHESVSVSQQKACSDCGRRTATGRPHSSAVQIPRLGDPRHAPPRAARRCPKRPLGSRTRRE